VIIFWDVVSYIVVEVYHHFGGKSVNFCQTTKRHIPEDNTNKVPVCIEVLCKENIVSLHMAACLVSQTIKIDFEEVHYTLKIITYLFLGFVVSTNFGLLYVKFPFVSVICFLPPHLRLELL
jgi:hypothetical protein